MRYWLLIQVARVVGLLLLAGGGFVVGAALFGQVAGWGSRLDSAMLAGGSAAIAVGFFLHRKATSYRRRRKEARGFEVVTDR